MGKMIEQIRIEKTSSAIRVESSMCRFGPNPLITIRECPAFCVSVIWSMLPERSKVDLSRFCSGQVLMLSGLSFECHGDFPTQS